MVNIQQDDLIESVRAALQYISFYHPVDYITNLARAYEMEQSPSAKDAMKQIRAAEWYNADKPPTIKESPHARGIFGLGR